MANTPEGILKVHVMDYLLSLPPTCMFWQNDMIGVKGRKIANRFRPLGIPDILGLVDGQFVGIELKDGKKKLRESQINFSARFLRAGGKYYVVRCLEDICEIVKLNGWLDGRKS